MMTRFPYDLNFARTSALLSYFVNKHGVQVISCTTFPFNPTGYEGILQKRGCSPEKTVARFWRTCFVAKGLQYAYTAAPFAPHICAKLARAKFGYA